MRRWLIALWLFTLSAQAACERWPLWESFKHHYVSNDGRVIDASVPERITTSEGQSYAMMFALAGNDQPAFEQLLEWTKNNLARGNLHEHLPAWSWGQNTQGEWQVLDANAASDADVWMAYALLEAGRLWRMPRYTQLGLALAEQILRDEVMYVPDLGSALLPGPTGFVSQGTWRFNASYLPLPALRLLTKEQGSLWNEVADSSLKIIAGSLRQGFAADWINYQSSTGFALDEGGHGVGSYNAIRVYLWVGMTPRKDASFTALQPLIMPALQQFARLPAPPESIDLHHGTLHGIGSPGFSAALIPLASHHYLNGPHSEWLKTQVARARGAAVQDGQHYYSDVLSLFGLGWLDGWLRFDKQGRLDVKWSARCVR